MSRSVKETIAKSHEAISRVIVDLLDLRYNSNESNEQRDAAQRLIERLEHAVMPNGKVRYTVALLTENNEWIGPTQVSAISRDHAVMLAGRNLAYDTYVKTYHAVVIHGAPEVELL